MNSQIIQEQAKALASNGMKEAGYEYVVIDEGWWPNRLLESRFGQNLWPLSEDVRWLF